MARLKREGMFRNIELVVIPPEEMQYYDETRQDLQRFVEYATSTPPSDETKTVSYLAEELTKEKQRIIDLLNLINRIDDFASIPPEDDMIYHIPVEHKRYQVDIDKLNKLLAVAEVAVPEFIVAVRNPKISDAEFTQHNNKMVDLEREVIDLKDTLIAIFRNDIRCIDGRLETVRELMAIEQHVVQTQPQMVARVG